MKSLFSSEDADASLPGLLIALMTLFDTDGSHTLSQKEWMDGIGALDLTTSDAEWHMLLDRFGSDDSAPGEISFANVVSLFGDIKPVEGYLEEILRRFMKCFVSMTLRMTGFESQMRAVQMELERTRDVAERNRQKTLNKIVRTWRNRHIATAFDGWRDLTKHNRDLLNRSARHWRPSSSSGSRRALACRRPTSRASCSAWRTSGGARQPQWRSRGPPETRCSAGTARARRGSSSTGASGTRSTLRMTRCCSTTCNGHVAR